MSPSDPWRAKVEPSKAMISIGFREWLPPNVVGLINSSRRRDLFKRETWRSRMWSILKQSSGKMLECPFFKSRRIGLWLSLWWSSAWWLVTLVTTTSKELQRTWTNLRNPSAQEHNGFQLTMLTLITFNQSNTCSEKWIATARIWSIFTEFLHWILFSKMDSNIAKSGTMLSPNTNGRQLLWDAGLHSQTSFSRWFSR